MWDLIVSVPDHCLSFYIELRNRMQVLYHTVKMDNNEDCIYGSLVQYEATCTNHIMEFYAVDRQ